MGKHTDELIEQLVMNTEGKTDCKQFNSDNWGGYERVLPPEIQHSVGRDKTQRLERTNGIVRQQTLSLASTTEQVWQSVGTDESDDSISGELLQLDLATQPIQNNCRLACRISNASVDLE